MNSEEKTRKGFIDMISALFGICLLFVFMMIGAFEYMIQITQNYSSNFVELFFAYSVISFGLFGLYRLYRIGVTSK